MSRTRLPTPVHLACNSVLWKSIFRVLCFVRPLPRNLFREPLNQLIMRTAEYILLLLKLLACSFILGGEASRA
jgi:hypothetical protein